MSRTLPLPRRVVCREGHAIPHPRVRPGVDGEPERIVGTCVACGTFYVGLERPWSALALGKPAGLELELALDDLTDELAALVREGRA